MQKERPVGSHSNKGSLADKLDKYASRPWVDYQMEYVHNGMYGGRKRDRTTKILADMPNRSCYHDNPDK